MAIKWLIEKYEGSIENFDDLYHCIKRMGDEVTILPWRPFSETDNLPYKDEDCVVSIGTIGFIDRIQRTKPWIPGTFCTFRNYDCATYYNYFQPFLLNYKYMMLPLGELRRQFKWLQEIFGKQLFIRPSNGRKSFTGQILKDEKDVLALEDSLSPETLIVVAAKQKIGCEFRYFIHGSTILDGSMYYNHNGVYEMGNVDELVGENADQEKMCREELEFTLKEIPWRPDSVWVADMCTFTPYKKLCPIMLEIGSISCSGWYACRPEKIVPAIREAAIKEWREYNE